MNLLKTGFILGGLTGLSLISAPLARGELIGYWPLNETAGLFATNMAPGGTIGILTNGAAWVNDPARGQVLSFDGVDDYVIAGTTPPIGIYSNFTWSFWASSQQAPNSAVMLGNRWNAESQSGSQWIKFTPTKFEYTSATTHLDYDDIPLNSGWMHHAVVKYGRKRIYYRNGIPLITNETVTSDMSARPFYMGGDKYGERWKGRIDDVAIWTVDLPPDAIAGLADGTLTPLTVPLYPTGSFDLADTIGGGIGRLPGLGGYGDLAAAPGVYSNYPAHLFVDGTFVPNKTPGAVVIDGAGHTYDFDAQTSGDYYNPWRNGNIFDTNPVDTNAVPDFLGDPANHSLISGHANKGITFDLDAVRDFTGRSISNFTAYIGDSRPKPGGSISYYVFVDGVLITNRFNITDSEDFVTVNQVSAGRYLSIAISDANNGISADHGYIGDPFLTLIPYVAPEPSRGTLIQ